jgi:hypothetical protein
LVYRKLGAVEREALTKFLTEREVDDREARRILALLHGKQARRRWNCSGG